MPKVLFYIPFIFFLLQSCSPAYRLPKSMEEVSGCYRAPDGTLWWLEDGGNEAALIQTDAVGKEIGILDFPFLQNKDWEALCADADGETWFIGDFGNNRNARKDLKIYIVDRATQKADSILFAYPDQWDFPPKDRKDWNFDCEGMYWKNDSLHLFSKNRFTGNFFAKHYVLPAKPGIYSPFLLDSIYLDKGVVTDAVYVEKTNQIALLTYWVKLGSFFPRTKGSIFLLSEKNGRLHIDKRIKLPKFVAIRQYETIEVLPGKGFIISNEKRIRQRHKLRVVPWEGAE